MLTNSSSTEGFVSYIMYLATQDLVTASSISMFVTLVHNWPTPRFYLSDHINTQLVIYPWSSDSIPTYYILRKNVIAKVWGLKLGNPTPYFVVELTGILYGGEGRDDRWMDPVLTEPTLLPDELTDILCEPAERRTRLQDYSA